MPELAGERPLEFLCHSFQNKEQIREIHRRLSAGGVRCWLDEDDILPAKTGAWSFGRC